MPEAGLGKLLLKQFEIKTAFLVITEGLQTGHSVAGIELRGGRTSIKPVCVIKPLGR